METPSPAQLRVLLALVLFVLVASIAVVVALVRSGRTVGSAAATGLARPKHLRDDRVSIR